MQRERLRAQGPRPLSRLEADAVDTVFKGRISLSNIELEILESIDPEEQGWRYINLETDNSPILEVSTEQQGRLKPTMFGKIKKPMVAVSAYYGNGKIKINGSAFPHTQALNINSTRRYIDLTDKRGEQTDLFGPGNMHYLSTLIHECIHYWQEQFDRHASRGFNKSPIYHFNSEQLKQRDVPDLSPEQHASAAQVYFLIEWQLEQHKGHDVNLTSRSEDSQHNVGPVDRFHNIDGYFANMGKGTSRTIKYEDVIGIIYDGFGWLLVELRHGWKAVCEGKEPFL